MTNLADNKAKIKEIFTSIQGEGLYIGVKQLFIRFCACNLHCNYCDTDYMPQSLSDKASFLDVTPNELIDYIMTNSDIENLHSVSLTGGEPLIWSDFLREFMPKFKAKYYLETNATIVHNIDDVIQNVDIISADIKLPSCSGVKNSFELHDAFFKKINEIKIDCSIKKQFNCDNENIFAKVVFDEKINDNEIQKTIELAKKYYFDIILQPKMIDDKPSVSSDFIIKIFEKFNKLYMHTRLIPQMHKFINIE